MADLFDGFEQEFDVEGEEKPSQPSGVARVMAGMQPAAVPVEDMDEELREAEKRIGKATYYRVIVRDGVIEDDGTAGAREINEEARFWARQQMARLIGIGRAEAVAPVPAAAPAQFSDKEVVILKKLAEVAEREYGAGKPAEPAVRKVQAAPAPAPVARKVQTVPAPKPAPAPKPEAKPAPAPKKPEPPKPAAAAAPAKKKGVGDKPRILKPKVVNGVVNYEAIPTGEIFRDPEDNRLYKFVQSGAAPNDPKVRFKRAVSGQAKTAGMIPMPSQHQQQQISQTQAVEAADLGGSANTIFPDKEGGVDVFVLAAAGATRKNQENE